MHVLELEYARYENAKSIHETTKPRAIVYLALCRFYGSQGGI